MASRKRHNLSWRTDSLQLCRPKQRPMKTCSWLSSGSPGSKWWRNKGTLTLAKTAAQPTLYGTCCAR